MELLEQQVRLQYKILGHDGFWTRVRYDDKQANEPRGKDEIVYGVERLIAWARPLCGRFNLYLSRNPFNKDGSVAGVNSFTADLDPVRTPKDRAASEAEMHAAVRAGIRLNQARFANSGVLSTSGNGALLMVPFEAMVEDVGGYTEQAQQYERELIKEFSTDEVRIDATNYAKALVKLMGSLSTKGDPKLHRYARTVGPVSFRRRNGLLQRIRAAKSPALPKSDLQLSHGNYKSRSEADYALALACKRSGFDAAATLKALQDYGLRDGRDDDHKRIIGKIFSATVGGTTPNNGTVSELWTPGAGIGGIKSANSEKSLSTGFKWLDSRLFGGYLPGRLYALEAPTNAGKTTFVVQAAFNIARGGKRVLLIATEMDLREFCERYYALGTGIPASTVLSGTLEPKHQSAVAGFAAELGRHQISVCFTNQPRLEEIEKHIETVKPDIVVWDYFQHMDTGTEHRQVQLGNFARWFENKAVQYDIPFLVAAQLHERYDFKSRTKLPALKDDIKDCKVLNDTAKTVMVLDWDKDSIQSEDGPISVTLSLQKNKGPMGLTKIKLDRKIPRFEEI